MMGQHEEPHEIVVVEQVAPSAELAPLPGSDPIFALMHLALEKGGEAVSQIERLVDLKIKLEDRAAAQEFARAMANFQAACPPIAKTSKAKIATKSGTSYTYSYAELDEIARTVGPLLHGEGLSYSWDSEIDAKTLKCVCTVRHANGHQLTASFALPIDNASGMSDAQKVAAALTYARRQSLIQALGLTTAEPDVDGAQVASAEKITAEEAALLAELAEAAQIKVARVLKRAKVERLEDVRAADYPGIKAGLEAHIKELRAKGAVA